MTIASWFSKMTGTAMTLDNLDKVLLMQLRDLYSAEQQLISALPKMAEAASSQKLKKAFQTHLQETRNQAKRLERAFKLLGQDISSENCEAMKGLIAEGSEIMQIEGDADVKDAALIAAAQRVEHYEIAGYGCARAFARRLGKTEVAKLLQETIEEEGNADKLLTSIAESSINPSAAKGRDSKDRAAASAEKKTEPRGRAKSMATGSKMASNGKRKPTARRTAAPRASTAKATTAHPRKRTAKSKA